MDRDPGYVLSEIRKNFDSLNWWRNRVFVPFVIGTATEIHPDYPGYDDAIRVMEEDWDTLVVLDACRADFFEEVADLTQFDEYERVVSLGSHSSEWTRRNFSGREFSDTVYVSANPHTSLKAGDAFHKIVELWETDTDEEAGVVFPDVVQKTAVDTHEKFPNKRLVIHFMQPHGPFISSDSSKSKDGAEYKTSEEYWQDYENTLEYVLPFALAIADTISGRTVITADHGQIFPMGYKQWLGLYSHPPRLRIPALVTVPWAVMEGRRRRIQSGTITEANGEDVEDRLRQFGYR